MVGSLFDGIDQVLSQRCSSTVQIYVRFLDAKFSPIDEKTVAASSHIKYMFKNTDGRKLHGANLAHCATASLL